MDIMKVSFIFNKMEKKVHLLSLLLNGWKMEKAKRNLNSPLRNET